MPYWNRLDRDLILASASPRRRDLLRRLGFAFTVQAPEAFDEAGMIVATDVSGSIARVAARKAQSVAARRPEALVLGSDTVVVAGGEVLGKPRDRADGRRMIGLLAGRAHTVLSSVALVCRTSGFEVTRGAATRVVFRKPAAEEIEEYLDRSAYLDKAGAYGIQEEAMAFVERVEGCYYNVVGLPVGATIAVFEEYLRHEGAGR